MGKRKDLSPRNKVQISVSLKHSDLKQKEIAKTLNISTQTVSALVKKLKIARNIHSSRTAKCGRRRKTTLRLDRKIKAMTLKDRRASCKKLSMELANQDIIVDRNTINSRLLEQGLNTYRPRKKPWLTQKMKQARYQWALQYENWRSKDWSKVRHLTKIIMDYTCRTIFLMLIRLFQKTIHQI